MNFSGIIISRIIYNYSLLKLEIKPEIPFYFVLYFTYIHIFYEILIFLIFIYLYFIKKHNLIDFILLNLVYID